ncbi:hypothetical protein OG440_14325 [Streptomyces sp. NBC_00637]|uniref:hypothetical protein n=1 Tax=Streptomyces sp. NBC_00637 TaxID=2903667 RepID=UPI003246E90A
MCLLVSVLAACGETNTYNQHAGRDGKLCVDGAECSDASEAPGTPESASGSPLVQSGSAAAGPEVTSDGEPPVESEPDEPARTAAESPSDVRVRYLTDIGPIGGYGNNEREDVSRLGDTPLTKSIVFSPGVFGKEVKALSFNIPTGLTEFKATVGLDGETLPDYVAQVDVKRRDGSTVSSLTLRSGEVHAVSEKVTGAGLITIEVTILEWASDAINSRPHVVVGDGRFVK